MVARLPRLLAVDWNGTVVPWFGEAPYADALEVLQALRAEGVFVAVVSHATPRQIEMDVARVGLDADEVHGVGAKAPTLRELAARFPDAVMVGDSPQDARAAQAAEIPFLQACFEGAPRFESGFGRLEAWSELDLLLAARPTSEPHDG